MGDDSRLRVELGPRSYDILIGPGLIAAAGQHLRPLLAEPRAFIVTDQRVGRHYLPTLQASLEAAGVASRAIVLPAGEQTKDFAHLADLASRLLAERIERRSLLIALGGGVIGDLTGFAASVLLRGIDFVQIPTTLLAQVDSSVGGKTGINTPEGKNLVGSFHQPRLVLADLDALATLPRRELAAGYAEVVKYGLVDDAPFFAWLEGHGAAILDGDPAARRHAIATACAAKARVVGADEREQDGRALLNLGHTFGHALEAECGYGDELLHGEAVAIGMVMAFDLSARLGLCPMADAGRVARHLASVGLPASVEAVPGRSFAAERLIGHMRRDKKVDQGRVAFVLARGIGKAFLAKGVDLAEVEGMLSEALAA
jgi:3-dehydroquinate synthase